MEKKQIILPSKRFDKSPDEDSIIQIGLNESQVILRENEKNIVLDLAELYNKERNESKRYKIHGKIKFIFGNEYSGTTNYNYLRNRLSLVGDGSDNDWTGYLPYNEFALLRNDLYREVNKPSSGDTITSFVQNISTTNENIEHVVVTTTTAPYQNWNLYLSYVYTGDSSFQMTYTLSGNSVTSFLSGDGIPFIVTSDDSHYILTSPVEHGMNVGEYIVMKGGSLQTSVPLSGRTFYIDGIGNETFRSENFVIKILKSQFTSIPPISNGMVILGKRCLDIKNIEQSTSIYYVHKHKVLTEIDEYVMDKVGFESSIWRDEKKLLFQNYSGQTDVIVEKNRMESVIYDFKKPFYLTGLTNNLGYTPTEVFLSVIYRNGNGYFDYPPKVGYKFNFHDTWIDQHFNSSSSIETGLTYTSFVRDGITFKRGEKLTYGSILIGSFIEYNDIEFKERVISDSFHHINNPTTIFNHNQNNPSYYSGSSNNNMVGLYYQPHYKVKLRELSPYIESSKTTDVYNLPENAKYYESEGLWKWRDLYDHGYIDDEGYGTNFSFINGTHYVKTSINLYLRNEKIYTNKKDGLIDFKNISIDC